MVLLLRVQVSQLPLPLSCHPSLSLHDLLCFVGASGRLVALRRVEVVQVGALRAAAFLKVTRATTVAHAAGCTRQVSSGQTDC